MKNIVGLSSEEVIKSRREYGNNAFLKEKNKGFFRRFLENLNDPIIKILIFALVIEVVFTFGKCNMIEVFGIILAILIATTVSTASEFGSERAFLKMQEEDKNYVKVLRDDKISDVPKSEIVVGDIVYLYAGEKIPADGVIISGSLRVDQSALNGESKEVSKYCTARNEKWDLLDNGQLFRGSLITSGDGVMEVCRVGSETYFGVVAKDVQTETRESPLKIRLSQLARQISRIGYVVAVVVALTYLFNTFVADNGFVWERIIASLKNTSFVFSSLINALTLMITVVVVAAPEGLPMMITVVLSANMKRMQKDGVLVKKLVGIETAGSMNILFTDKTGTITTGNIECDRFIAVDSSFKNLKALKASHKLYDLLLLSAKHNTDTHILDGVVIGGNATDRAISSFFKNEAAPKINVVDKVSFTSEKKYSSVTFGDGSSIIKGAPELILKNAQFALDSKENIVPIDRKKIEEEYQSAAAEGNRVIAIGYKTLAGAPLIFLSLLVLKDKIRRGVFESVLKVQRAGIQVVMLTGDGKETATSIAQECGICTGNETELVLTSSELNSMTDEEVKSVLPKLRVLARALPQDKTRLVRLSQELDFVVGMTGDGINDAPSLKLADVGFSMGSGSDIAKDAGDIVILDNSFLSINRTILYGRTIFKSIRKFITFQLIMNLTACGISLIGQFMGIDSPITIIQMLWVNIIMDTLGGLAFAGEPPLEYYMYEKPKKRTEPILSTSMIHHIVFTGAYTLLLCVLFLTSDSFRCVFRVTENDICYLTAFYALFIFSGIFNCFGARCERIWILSNIRKNKLFVFIMIIISVIQIAMIYYGGALFRSVPLATKEFLVVIVLAFSVIPFEFLRRIFYKLKRK